MENKFNLTQQESQLMAALASFLKSKQTAIPASQHLDDDTLAAFVEGRLSERELKPAISHLVECSFCLRLTAELIRTAEDEAPEAITAFEPAQESSRLSEIIANLFERIFGSTERAVFAHQEEEKREEESEDIEPKEDIPLLDNKKKTNGD